MTDNPQELTWLNATYDALDDGDPETALQHVREAAAGGADDPVVNFFEGVCLMELGRADEAIAPLQRAVEADPNDHDFRGQLAFTYFRACRFSEAREALNAIAEDQKQTGEFQFLHGLILEREGKFKEADRAFVKANEENADKFEKPFRMTREAFDTVLKDGLAKLPPNFREALDEVAIRVDDLPGVELLTSEKPYFEPEELLGLFVGAPKGEAQSGDLAPQIYLFQRNLERESRDEAALTRDLVVTLYHEIGHYFGMDEEDLAEANFD